MERTTNDNAAGAATPAEPEKADVALANTATTINAPNDTNADAVSRTTRTHAPKPRGRPFERGRSGNPSGRPAGSLGKKTLAAQRFIETRLDALIKVVDEAARAGDGAMIRFLIARVLPRQRDRFVTIDIPDLNSPWACDKAMQRTIQSASAGEITLSEAERLVALINARRAAFDRVGFDRHFEDGRADAAYERLCDLYPPRLNPPVEMKVWLGFWNALCDLDLRPRQRNRVWHRFNNAIGDEQARRLRSECSRSADGEEEDQ